MKRWLPLFMLLVVVVSGCDVNVPSKGAQAGFHVSGYAAPLSEEEYGRLSDEEKYRVANKLLSSFYRGIPVADFFDLSQGMEKPSLKEGRGFLSSIEAALSTPLDSATRQRYDSFIEGDEESGIEARFRFRQLPKERPLARITTYPLSKDMFDHWMAWHLANTILFSPAEEIDSANINDVQKVYNKLVDDLRNGKTIRQIISRHQRTQENWRRFRSPEDNTREMIEIYLGLFDRDEDVPRAAIACKDLYLSGEDEGYELLSTGSPNTEPQLVLGTYVTNCDDFYDLIAGHPLVIGRVTTVLVEYFFAGRSNADRLRIVRSITASNPTTFEEIFKGILFSREYLLNTERPKSFEESFFGTAERLDWTPSRDLFQGVVSNRGDAARAYMGEMNWPTMSLKLGRLFGIPMDSLSFANYHKGFREVLLIRKDRWRKGLGLVSMDEPDEDASDETQQLYERNQERFALVEEMSPDEYLDYLFLGAALRRADAVEKTTLINIARDAGYVVTKKGRRVVRDGYHDDLAQLVFDYVSRLPETYYFKAIN